MCSLLMIRNYIYCLTCDNSLPLTPSVNFLPFFYERKTFMKAFFLLLLVSCHILKERIFQVSGTLGKQKFNEEQPLEIGFPVWELELSWNFRSLHFWQTQRELLSRISNNFRQLAFLPDWRLSLFSVVRWWQTACISLCWKCHSKSGVQRLWRGYIMSWLPVSHIWLFGVKLPIERMTLPIQIGFCFNLALLYWG